jgi:hypothetical protein
MQHHEATEARALIDRLLAKGGSVSVNDGEQTTLHKSRDAALILAAMATTDQDSLRWFDPSGLRVGIFHLIYGNGPGELVADCTDSDLCHAVAFND